MRRHHETPAEFRTYQRPNGVMAQPRALAYHGSARGYGEGRDEDYSPPDESSRGGRGDKKPRKRNSVACARCRKRKIKCTGDLQDGHGCEACQQAGTSPNNCFYLRVNSLQLDDAATAALQPSLSESEWPYSVPNPSAYASSMPRITSDPSQYALANANMLPPSTGAPYFGQGNGRTAGYGDLSGVQYPTIVAPRQFVSSSYHSHLENQPSQYDMQSTRHGYPLQVTQTPATGFPNLDHSHSWTPLSASSKQLYHNSSYDGDVSSSYASSAYQYTGVTGASLPAITTEGTSIFPGLSPLSTHLPSAGASRTLPNPSSLHGSFDGNNGSTEESENVLGILQQQYDKNKDSWDLYRMTTGTSQGSVSSIAHDSMGAGTASSTSSSSPDDDTSFGYIPLTHSSVESGINTSNYRSARISATLSNIRGSTTSGSQSSIDVISGLPALNPSYDMYGSHASVGGNDTSAPEVASPNGLPSQVAPSSGLPAPRILHPQPCTSSSSDLLKATRDDNPKRTRKFLKSSVKSQSIAHPQTLETEH